jgi:hypothetical protein
MTCINPNMKVRKPGFLVIMRKSLERGVAPKINIEKVYSFFPRGYLPTLVTYVKMASRTRGSHDFFEGRPPHSLKKDLHSHPSYAFLEPSTGFKNCLKCSATTVSTDLYRTQKAKLAVGSSRTSKFEHSMRILQPLYGQGLWHRQTPKRSKPAGRLQHAWFRHFF